MAVGEDAGAARVLVITVGPPCAGKSTVLAKREPAPLDVCIDDSPGLYARIPWADLPATSQAAIVRAAALLEGGSNDRDDDEEDALAARLEATVAIRDDSERRACARALARAIGYVRRKYPRLAEQEARLASEAQGLQTRLMRKAVAGAQTALGEAMAAGVPLVAWGNTNTKMPAIAHAVALADEHGYAIEVVNMTDVDFDELVKRSVLRMLKTGKVVPVEAIYKSAVAAQRSLVETGLVFDAAALAEAARASVAGSSRSGARR